jgi:diguanylate cyclase (GGDEF)-like protein/PAS domain S-box-containing protein
MGPAKANRKTVSKKSKAAPKPKSVKSQETAKALIEGSDLLLTLINNLPDPIYVKDIQGRKMISNTADWQASGGKRMEDVIGKTDFDIYPAELAAQFWADDKMVLDSGKLVINREEPGRDSQDNPIWRLTTKMPLRDDNGQVVGLVGIGRDITERKRVEQLIRARESILLHTLIDNLPDHIYAKDAEGRFTLANIAVARHMRAAKPDELIGKTDFDFYPPDLAMQFHADEQALIQSGESLLDHEEFTRDQADQRKWVLTTKVLLHDSQGNYTGLVGIGRDITERKQAEAALQESKERYEIAVRGANDGIWDWNLKTNELYYSPRWKAMLGYEESQIGTSSDEWFKRVHPDDLMRIKAELNAHLKGDTALFQSQYRILHANGQYLWMLSRGLAIRDTEEHAFRMAGSQTDISLQKQAEERLAHDALHDALTGLPNRTLFLDRLEHAMRRVKRSKDSLFAVMFLDLDRFKLINDSLGHVCGDQLLVSIAERLQRCLRPGDTVARMGGDEFAVLLDGISAAADTTRVADRIQKELAQPYILDGHSVSVSASIGITLSSANYKQADEMLRDADIAMYRAKTMGKAQHQIFDTGMHAAVASLLELEADLRRAIQNEEFQVYYQPLISLASGTVVGTEALLRWQNPKRGLLPPSAFITILEETGMIVPVGEWVLRTACKQNKAWQDAGFPHLRVAVNFSARQFRIKNLAELIQSVLVETGMPAETLELEITESTALKDTKLTLETLNQLHELGINISLDDFGTGYSALGYLNRYPFQTLKADRTFISDIPGDSKDTAITAAIIAMAHSLKLRVVAEGVETSEQLDFLRSNSCDEVQGFLFSRPVPADELANLLQKKELLPKPDAADKPNVQPPS